MSLPNGVMKVQEKGGYGDHIGGNQPGKMDMRAFLLQKFSTEERARVGTALDRVEAMKNLVLKGFSRNIDWFISAQKYKYHRVCKLHGPSKVLHILWSNVFMIFKIQAHPLSSDFNEQLVITSSWTNCITQGRRKIAHLRKARQLFRLIEYCSLLFWSAYV